VADEAEGRECSIRAGAEGRECSIRAGGGAGEGQELGLGGAFVGSRARSLERCGAVVSAGNSRVAACEQKVAMMSTKVTSQHRYEG